MSPGHRRPKWGKNLAVRFPLEFAKGRQDCGRGERVQIEAHGRRYRDPAPGRPRARGRCRGWRAEEIIQREPRPFSG